MSDMTLMDSRWGLAVIPAGNDPDPKEFQINNVKFYAETPADDCPDDHDCYCADKMATMMSGSFQGKKDLHPTMPSALPVHK